LKDDDIELEEEVLVEVHACRGTCLAGCGSATAQLGEAMADSADCHLWLRCECAFWHPLRAQRWWPFAHLSPGAALSQPSKLKA